MEVSKWFYLWYLNFQNKLKQEKKPPCQNIKTCLMNYTKDWTHQKELYTNMYIKMPLSRSGTSNIYHLQSSSSSSSGSGLDLKTEHRCHNRPLKLQSQHRSNGLKSVQLWIHLSSSHVSSLTSNQLCSTISVKRAAPDSRSDSSLCQ